MNHFSAIGLRSNPSPPDEDDRWESIAQQNEEKYSTGTELRDRVESVLEGLDLVSDFTSIYAGHDDDLPVSAERLVRQVMTLISDRIQADAKEDAIAEVDEADEQARLDAGEDAYYAQRERWCA